MSAKAIRESKGKQLLYKYLSSVIAPVQTATYTNGSQWDALVAQHPWLSTQKLVVKPDQLIKRRGKLGLIKVNADLAEVKTWIAERMEKEVQVNFFNQHKTFQGFNNKQTNKQKLNCFQRSERHRAD